MKRFVCILAVLFLLAMLPVTALAGDAGTCGEGITWEYSEGVLTISGSGKMSDFTEGGAPWEAYKEQITTVKFTGGVMVPPIASSARNEIAPSAVLATRAADQRRALLAVKRSA